MCAAGNIGRPKRAGAPRRDLARAAEQDHRVRLRERPRRDPHGGAAVLERLAGPRLEQRVDALVHERAALGPVLAVRRVLRRAVADADDRREPAAAREVEHGDVLGDAQRVVQRQEQRRDGDADRSWCGRRPGRP